MSNQPIVFNHRFTTYKPKKGATLEERKAHAAERAFYNMTGEFNIYDYMTKEEKLKGEVANGRAPPQEEWRREAYQNEFTFLEYLQKSTGVFNQKGMISKEELAGMKERAKKNKGNIWHGFISFNKEESHKIDTPEKCIGFVRNTFGTFFKAAKLDEKNLDLMCSLHLDRPHHLHIHYSFWEKEPKFRSKSGDELTYRRNGFVDMAAIDTMFVKAGIWVSEGKDRLHQSRDNAREELRKLLRPSRALRENAKIREAILALSNDLPATGRLSYGSKDMEPFRARVDGIVDMLLRHDPTARAADREFRFELSRRKQVIKNVCNQPFAYSDKDVSPEEMEKNLPKYHHTIDDSNIHIVEDIEADYKRRMGNVVLQVAKDIKPEMLKRERERQTRHRAGDNNLKRRLHVSNRKTGRILSSFLQDFGQTTSGYAGLAKSRLREIEEELSREQEEQNKTIKAGAYH